MTHYRFIETWFGGVRVEKIVDLGPWERVYAGELTQLGMVEIVPNEEIRQLRERVAKARQARRSAEERADFAQAEFHVKYQQLFDGQRLRFVDDTSHTFSCCDCGLSHRFTIGKAVDHTVEVTIAADKRATAGRRRARAVIDRIKELSR